MNGPRLFPIFLLLFLIGWMVGCGRRYDYSVHPPKVLYKTPSKEALHKLLEKQLGKEYVWAEEGPDAFDCSGLTYYCYGSMNVKIPRVAREQAKVGRLVSTDKLQYGDLLFFDTTARKTGQITHVGVYIGDGKFEHAANEKQGVKISSLSDPYYKSRLKLARRYLPDENATLAGFTPLEPLVIASGGQTPAQCKKCFQSPAKVTADRGDQYIQIGSFRGEPNRAWLAHVKAAGYAYRTLYEDGMKKLLVGPFLSREDALSILPSVQREFNPGAFLKRLKTRK
ncbi:NlpC/P60 family protein [Nitratifractor sp.]